MPYRTLEVGAVPADRLIFEDEDEPQGDLPNPDSDEMRELLRDDQRAVYRVLYERRGNPPTMQEIRTELGPELGTPEQLDRRKRELHPYFAIERIRSGRQVRFRLSHRKARSESEAVGISERTRARVLQHGRCAMCGRTPLEHGVVLQVDHKMPQAWGGTNDLENLQALCEECNRGKKDHFRSLDRYGRQIREAGQHHEPHKRIGELLKALHPDEVRSDIIEMVAHQQQYQEDWHKRMRELKELGWNYRARRERDSNGRVRVYYRLTKWEPWPPGNIRAEITRRENDKKKRRRRAAGS
jgi:5-methylcytosine-specific restriction endonuclease McrA